MAPHEKRHHREHGTSGSTELLGRLEEAARRLRAAVDAEALGGSATLATRASTLEERDVPLGAIRPHWHGTIGTPSDRELVFVEVEPRGHAVDAAVGVAFIQQKGEAEERRRR